MQSYVDLSKALEKSTDKNRTRGKIEKIRHFVREMSDKLRRSTTLRRITSGIYPVYELGHAKVNNSRVKN